MSQTTPTDQHSEQRSPVFPSVLCGVDGSRASLEAVRQAATLAPAGRMHLLAVTWEQGVGANAVAVLSRWRAEEALGRAQRDLHELGIAPSVELVEDLDATGRLLREAMAHDLLALGTHGHSRAGGIMTGSTASAALHRATIPVLIARPLPQPCHLLDRVLLAVDGTEPSFAAARTTAALVKRHAAAVVTLVAPTTQDRSRRHVTAACAGEILEATGIEPVVLDEAGPSHRAIVRAATEEAATLVVLGSRRLAGAAALRSVSERVAHAAPCSVLVVRGPVVWP
jgi:nucleotide-binding universal stress UspA family protein